MSVWNIHINWYPVSGIVEYFRHHQGRFLVALASQILYRKRAYHHVVQVEGTPHRLLFRQIAGYVARRIVSYSEEGTRVTRGSECGFIKFGSRVDIFLPLGSEVQ